MILYLCLNICSATGVVDAGLVGINHDFIWTDEEIWEPLADWMAETGVTWCRMPIRWVTVEPEKGRWDFSKADRAVHLLRDRGIGILGILLSIPSWANGKKPGEVEGWYDAYPPNSLDDWAAYVRRTVERYQDEIRYWEIWNEENGVDFYRPMPDAKQYVELLSAAHEACKEANPDSVVVLGGLQMNGIIPNPWSSVKIENFLQKIYDAGGKPYFEVVNIHPYILSSDQIEKMVDMISGTIEVMKRNGDAKKPIWITEVGCGLHEDPDGTKQAGLLEATFREGMKIPGVERIFWFTLRDYPRDVVGPESSMGVLTVDLEEKPAARALRRLVASLEQRALEGTDSQLGNKIELKRQGDTAMSDFHVVFEDDFESYRTGTADLPEWEVISGQWAIVEDEERGSKVLVQKSPFGDNMYALSKKSFAGDFVLEADVKMVGTNRWGCGLVTRCQNEGDLYQFEMWDVHPFVRFWVWKDYRYDAPAGMELTGPISLKQWYHMSIACEGTKYTCALSPGNIRFEADDDTYLRGRVGVNASGMICFDNVRLSVRE